MGKVGRRPQAAKSPMKRSPLRSGHRVVAQASFFDPAGQFIFSHPTEKPPPLSVCHSADPPASRAGAQNKMERTARRGQPSPFSFNHQIILRRGGTAYRYTSSRRGRFLRKTRRFAPGRAFRGALVPPGGPPPLDQGTGDFYFTSGWNCLQVHFFHFNPLPQGQGSLRFPKTSKLALGTPLI